MVENRIKRYSIGDRTKGLKTEADGSLTLYIQAKSPGPDRESNWLPAPDGDFFLQMRLYEPTEEVLNGNYQLPQVMTNAGVTPTTFNARIVALRFFFATTCGREEMKRHMNHPWPTNERLAGHHVVRELGAT